MNVLETLQDIRRRGGKTLTTGLDDETITRFAAGDDDLVAAVADAAEAYEAALAEFPELMAMDEPEQVLALQEGFVKFYPADTIVPYAALAARGPWIVTTRGAVIYECGGYGMLGFGHAPPFILEAMNRPHVMANIMTPSLSQRRLVDRLRREIGHTRGECPYHRFVCLSSGSEAVTLAARLSDVNARQMTDPGGPHAHQPIRKLGLKMAFHGRTDRPAQFSDSTRKAYCQWLASFRDSDTLITVEPNDLQQLGQVFEYAERNRVFIEAMFFEPVMGEGNPGRAMKPEFYALARELTRKHGSVLLADSIQAGLRAHGVLSIVDYPGFEGLEAPDFETFSKALTGGQYPLSVLALTERAAELYHTGLYGNTMTTNPRALDVACAALDHLTPALRRNIVERGRQFIERFEALAGELGGRVTGVQGTGLLFSVELDATRYKGFGADSAEEYLRQRGLNVIHGGANSLRFTPRFSVTEAEVDLIVDLTRDAILNGPQKVRESAAA